jgi:hypothetical protein
MTDLRFALVREMNDSRCQRWHGSDWKSPDDAWTVADWSNAMGGEAGEAQNIVKKIRRVQAGLWDAQKYPGDSAASSSLVDLPGLVLHDCVRRKFNRVSDAQGFPERL